jgi:hypothetical protein
VCACCVHVELLIALAVYTLTTVVSYTALFVVTVE